MPRLTIVVLLVLGISLLAAEAPAQRGRRGGFYRIAPRDVPEGTYDGSFRFCRISFRNSPEGDGDGWYVDYPRADENLSIRLAELTKAPVSHDLEGSPEHYVVRLIDPALFQCPFVMM